MKKNKQLGIWMDHSNAYIMELENGAITENIIASEFSHQDKELSLSKGENSMHTKEQHLQKWFVVWLFICNLLCYLVYSSNFANPGECTHAG